MRQQKIFRVDKPADYAKAGATDLIKMLPPPGAYPMFVQKFKLEAICAAFTRGLYVHCSGQTGTGKSALLHALARVPENFQGVCKALGFPVKPLRVFPCELCQFEAASDLWQRRSIRDGTTYDEPSALVQAIDAAATCGEESYSVVWIRELGRANPGVQSGLLDLLTPTEIQVGSKTIHTRWVSFCTDSNYQAASEETFDLVALDAAVNRRLPVRITFDPLPAEMEVEILKDLAKGLELKLPDPELIAKVVRLCQLLRKQRNDGNLRSLPPATLPGALAFLMMASALPHFAPQQIAAVSLLGCASPADSKITPAVFAEAFGTVLEADGDSDVGGDLL